MLRSDKFIPEGITTRQLKKKELKKNYNIN